MQVIEEKEINGSEVRSLKVQSKHRANRWSETFVPELKLCGHWLADWGFPAEGRVEVKVSRGLIVIRPEQQV